MLVFPKRLVKDILKRIINYFSESDAYVYKRVIREKYIWFGNEWSDYWKSFYCQNYSRMPELISNLKKGLSAYDQSLIDLIWERYFNILVSPKYHKSVLYSEKILFTSDELEERKLVEPYMRRIRKVIRLSNDHYEVPVFYYENGLKFIKDKVDISYLNNTIFVDGGAYNGDSAIVFYRYNPIKILMFEPSKINCKLINETLNLNYYLKDICEVFQLALGSDNSISILHYEGSASSIMHAIDDCTQKEEVKIVKLDDFLKDINSRVGLIKLDIEGFEYEAITGSLNLIHKHRPILLISIYHTPKDFFYIKPLLETSIPDYSFIIRKLNPYHPTYETMLICWPKEISKG